MADAQGSGFGAARISKKNVPHAGAFLPILADRLAPALQMMPDIFGDHAGEIDVYAALLQIVDAGQLLYGSDYPYTPESGCMALASALDTTDLLTDGQRHAIYLDNALRLFPEL